MKNNFPDISILIPTLNAGRVLEECLEKIKNQNYPRQKVEIIIADGGSTDNTLEVAKKYKAQIIPNPLKTGEAGKAVALRQAKGDLVALIDSDNFLPQNNWLQKMTAPFSDPKILGSEPWKFTYRRSDSFINRYAALMGVNDPYCYFMGNYDRYNYLSQNWTGLSIPQEDKGSHLKITLEKGKTLPTIGANGTLWRRDILLKTLGKSNYLFDTDIPYLLARKRPFFFAKVKVGIIHLYCSSLSSFIRKQTRRAKDFFYLSAQKERQATFQRHGSWGQLRFIISTLLVFPLIFQSFKGYLKKPDPAWFFHPMACLVTFFIYARETVLSFFKKDLMSRKNYGQ